MLPREQAKTKECPLRAAGYWANPNSNMSPEDGALNCRAEDCPKWVDVEYDQVCGKWKDCQTRTEFSDIAEKQCNACPHRYGRCGG